MSDERKLKKIIIKLCQEARDEKHKTEHRHQPFPPPPPPPPFPPLSSKREAPHLNKKKRRKNGELQNYLYKIIKTNSYYIGKLSLYSLIVSELRITFYKGYNYCFFLSPPPPPPPPSLSLSLSLSLSHLKHFNSFKA